ncbi:MAG: pyrimidine dimer DNA glycosylase/endonuclease V [Thermomicrobiales bacterium]
MRIWDVSPSCLCRQHLLGEHRELHALWTILTEGKTGYLRHPETRRWQGKLAALYQRHESLVAELGRRGYQHHSPLDPTRATGLREQTDYVDSPAVQLELLRAKGCACRTGPECLCQQPTRLGTAAREEHDGRA